MTAAATKTAAEKNIPLSEEEIEILAQDLVSKAIFKDDLYKETKAANMQTLCKELYKDAITIWGLIYKFKEYRQPTIPIATEAGTFYCDACGCVISKTDDFCTGCSREIDWYK